MKLLAAVITLILFNTSLLAHNEGHNQLKNWIVNGNPMKAEFVKYEDGNVFFLNEEHTLVFYNLDALSPQHREIILNQHNDIVKINELTMEEPSMNSQLMWFLIGGFLMGVSIFSLKKKRKKFHLSYGIVGALLILISACSKDDENDDNNSISTPTTPPANDVNFMSSLFKEFSGVTTSSDDTYFYISSNGIPNHSMMKGITAWNEQVPIDHPYTNTNSWSIPIQPVLADNPLSTESNFLKGAIAVAVNGIPIFNPLNNRGEDTNTIGELDEWGGHSGRADDYHYHVPPTHLESIVGKGSPIAYALDGFPVYGETTEKLDEYLGILNDDGSYQYHTITSFPYFIAGMRGKVSLDPNTTAPENQIIPQAFTTPLRSDLDGKPQTVLITKFEETSSNNYRMTYTQNGETYIINYGWDDNNLYSFQFVNPDGSSTTDIYQR